MKTPLLTILALSALALTACTAAPAPTPDPETYVSGTDAPTDTSGVETPGPLEPDTTVVVTALATAANGATLTLELRAHSAIRFDDIANQTIPAAFVQDCGFSDSQLAGGAWSFVRANLTALPGGDATWPTDDVITLAPSAASVDTVGRGMLAAEGACAAEKSFAGPGNGALALGIAGDADALTGWTQHAFGFTVAADSGITLSDCTATLTDLGAAAASTAAWTPSSTAATCVAGTMPERVER